MIRREIAIEDIAVGDVVEFWDDGFRFAIVTQVKKSIKRKTKAISYWIHTDRYGKIDFSEVKEIYSYDGKKTTPKPLMSDIFI